MSSQAKVQKASNEQSNTNDSAKDKSTNKHQKQSEYKPKSSLKKNSSPRVKPAQLKKRADRTDPQGSNAEEFKESLLVKENTEDADESNPTGYIPECVPPPKFPSIVISNPESSNNFSTLQENINTVLHSPVETMLNRKEFLLNLTKTVGAKLYKPAKKAKGKPTRQELDHMISTAKKLRGANDKETSVNNEFNPEEYLNNRNKKFKSLKGTYKKTNKPKRLKDLLRIKFNSPLDYFLQRTAPTRVKTNLIPDSKNKIENFVVSNNLDNMGDFGNFLSSKRGHQIIAESNLSSTYLHRRNNTQKKETKKEINKLMGYIKSSQSNSKGAPSDRKDHDDNRLKLKLMNVSAMTTAPSRGSLTSGFQPIPFTDKTLTPKEAASSFCSNKVPAEVNTDSQTLNLRKSGESARSLSTVEVQAKKRLSYSQKLSNKKLGVVAPSEYNAFSQYVPKQELIDKTLKKNHNEALESIFKKNNSAIKKITNTKSSKEKKENKNSQKVVDKSTINEEYLIEYNELARYINDCKYYNLDYNKHNEYPATTLSFYKYGRPLGRGAFGKVNIGLHIASGRLVAIKTFNKDNLTLESTQRKLFLETTLMKTLQHKNIVRIYETFETDKYHMIILEYVCGGDLMSYVRKRNYLSENVARFLFRQLIEALKYMHAQGIVHRDIKLDNILLDVDRNIKICDFGVSKLNPKNSIMYEQCGTPAYIAPEILLDEGYSGFGVDIWSSGVLLYVMLSGMMPFKADTLEDLKGLIVSGQYPSIKDISPEAESLISGLLTVDPTQRLTEDQILSHPWMKIKNYDSKNIQLFTSSELLPLKKNLLDFRTASKEEIFENFSLSNLDTMKDSERFNVNTRSTLRSPRVSMYKDPSLLDRFDDFRGKSIEVNNKAMHLNALVKEANRNYECVQIGEVDNVLPRQNSVNLTSSLYNDSKEGKEGREESRRRLSQKDLNSLALIAQKKSFKNVKFGNADLNIMEYNSNLNDASIKEIEMLGYERDYIVRCLRNNDLNYCTAFYYLLSKKSE